MTVELARNAPGQGPFVWPDPPTDFAPWSKSIYHTAQKAQEKASKRRGPQADRLAPTDGRTIGEQAKALREGRARWVPGWVDYGGARVVVGEEGGGGGGGGGEGGGGERGKATDAGWSYGRTESGDASR
ncbi:hypothetical protein MMC22_008175 [Lobaria immixta]|nr:hypothetical protein [Lobaria immixta]